MNDLLAKSLIVAHGPVIVPAGGYGLSLYQIADDQEIAALTSEDPIVKNGVGHYEHFQMPHLTAQATAPLNAVDLATFYTPGPKGYTDCPALAA